MRFTFECIITFANVEYKSHTYVENTTITYIATFKNGLFE